MISKLTKREQKLADDKIRQNLHNIIDSSTPSTIVITFTDDIVSDEELKTRHELNVKQHFLHREANVNAYFQQKVLNKKVHETRVEHNRLIMRDNHNLTEANKVLKESNALLKVKNNQLSQRINDSLIVENEKLKSVRKELVRQVDDLIAKNNKLKERVSLLTKLS
ncbi:hypothetical protein [Shewanella sp.]|uniref:hypothetical protein n=1 Tax=Shewanella sp. TaxID=50422 RepID=UPI0040477297